MIKGYGKIDKVPIPVSETGKGCTNKLDMHQAPKKKIIITVQLGQGCDMILFGYVYIKINK